MAEETRQRIPINITLTMNPPAVFQPPEVERQAITGGAAVLGPVCKCGSESGSGNGGGCVCTKSGSGGVLAEL